MAREPKSLFRRLTRLFRSGPVVKRKIRALDTTVAVGDKTKSSGTLLFQKSLSPSYGGLNSSAYNLSERLMRYQDFQEMEYSLAINTPISTPDGFKTIGELADACAANPDHTFVVYSYDHVKKQIVPALGKQARQTCVDHAWKVTFDNGKEITGSPEHRLMLRDGSYRKIEDLKPGDAMMPFYRKDLFAGVEEGTKGYSWVYTMDKRFRGWTKEHQLVAEWVAGRVLADDECVHHINFVKTDNRPENLRIMTQSDHNSYHAALNNGHKWAPENKEWIESFKQNHSVWMRDNAPTRRKDVTFARILETCERVGFSMPALVLALDVSPTLVCERLLVHGFSGFKSFVASYSAGQAESLAADGRPGLLTRDLSIDLISQHAVPTDTKASLCIKLGCTVNVFDKFLARRARVSWSDLRKTLGFELNEAVSSVNRLTRKIGRPKGSNGNDVTFKHVCDAYEPGMTLPRLSAKLGTNKNTVLSRLAQQGHEKYTSFQSSYENCKVVSVEYVGVIPLYDLTVDGYKNFATDSVVSHNTPEIAAALDIYADETVASDEKGRCLHIYSENEKIRVLLEDVFYNVLNVEFNLRSWARNLPVHKDTVVPLLDGRNITIEQLAREHETGKQNWVYSVQDGTHRTVPGKIAWCGLTRKDSELVRVWLDDGTYVDCTPDHEWVTRDGQHVRADKLLHGQSMMPMYRRVDEKKKSWLQGYEQVYDPASDAYVYTHRRVSEVLDKTSLKTGRWLVTHHRDFNKRNNDPANLVWMDEKDHLQLHRQLALDVLHSPEVTAKRMAGIDKWLRSDRHRVLARKQLKTLQATGLMKTSWVDYNSSEQAQSDNVKRSQLKKEMWKDVDRRASAVANMKIKFDAKCVDMIVERLDVIGKYVSPKVFGTQLQSDATFMEYVRSINVGTKRDLSKSLNSPTGLESLLQKAGVVSYIDLVKERLPKIAASPWFQRAVCKSKRMTGVVPAMRAARKNHKIDRVERLTKTDDVYCMEVLGPEGEHDRHRFMILTRDADGKPASSGICSTNCKYGDFFLFNDVSPEYGVINAFPIPVNEIEREENYDREDPFAVRYRWVTLGNRTLENWEVTHFRLLGNDMFLPYGSSIIEPARRIWRQLILIEDAMLVYRVVRAPERRVFYIDVANLPPHEVPTYIEQQRANLRTAPVGDRQTGRVDLRYNPISVEEDYFIPVRGGESGTKIDTLAGGQNTAAVEDVAYIQKKLFAALKIPRAYLGYDEMLSSKATLAQEDIRFSRTINVIQKTILAELNKLAIIHLYAHGFDNDDLQNFVLRLSNPSTVAQQQKLELWRAKFEIAGSAPEGMGSKEFVRREIWGLNEEQIEQIDNQRLKEKKVDALVEAAGMPDEDDAAPPGGGAGGADDLFGGDGAADAPEPEPDAGADAPPEENAGETPEEEKGTGRGLLTGGDNPDDDEDFSLKLKALNDKPINVKSHLDRVLYNRGRRRTHGASKTHMPDFVKMTSANNRSAKDPYDNDWIRATVSNPFGEASRSSFSPIKLPLDVSSTLKRMSTALGLNTTRGVIGEAHDVQDEIDAGQDASYEIDVPGTFDDENMPGDE